MLLPSVPSWVRLLGNQLAMFQRTRSSSAWARPAVRSAALNTPAARPALIDLPTFICVLPPIVSPRPAPAHSDPDAGIRSRSGGTQSRALASAKLPR